jgi:hypothetical protein
MELTAERDEQHRKVESERRALTALAETRDIAEQTGAPADRALTAPRPTFSVPFRAICIKKRLLAGNMLMRNILIDNHSSVTKSARGNTNENGFIFFLRYLAHQA